MRLPTQSKVMAKATTWEIGVYPDLYRRRLLKLWMATMAILPRAQADGSGFREGYVAGDGAQLFYVSAADARLMLFLHGPPDGWSLYESQLREFSRVHRVVAPNPRGFPPSDQPEAVESYAM